MRATGAIRWSLAVGALGAVACGAKHAPPTDPVAAAADPVAADPIAADPPAIENAALAPRGNSKTDDSVVPVPDEPWYHDKTEGRRDDCELGAAAMPRPHFPAPFEMCDTHAESWASPPGGNELHFHYRFFSAALTAAQRTRRPGVCCYMVWEFPPRD